MEEGEICGVLWQLLELSSLGVPVAQPSHAVPRPIGLCLQGLVSDAINALANGEVKVRLRPVHLAPRPPSNMRERDKTRSFLQFP